MKYRRLAAVCLAIGLMADVPFGAGTRAQAAMPETETVMPLWESVSRANVYLTLSGNNAACQAVITGKSNVKSISGTMTLSLIQTNGTVSQIQSWNLYGSQKIEQTENATVTSSGIYQLSFSGTVTMTDGSTEVVTASTTQVK